MSEQRNSDLCLFYISLPIFIVVGLIGGRWLSVNLEYYDGYSHWIVLVALSTWQLFKALGGGDLGSADMSGTRVSDDSLFDSQSQGRDRPVSSGESDADAFEGPGDGD